MAITLMCPNLLCRKVLMVPETARGTRVRCSYCGTLLFVPRVKSQNAGKTMADLAMMGGGNESAKNSKKGKAKEKS